jgi:hypothetical protein
LNQNWNSFIGVVIYVRNDSHGFKDKRNVLLTNDIFSVQTLPWAVKKKESKHGENIDPNGGWEQG